MYFTCNTVKKHCIVFKDTASPILRYYFVQKNISESSYNSAESDVLTQSATKCDDFYPFRIHLFLLQEQHSEIDEQGWTEKDNVCCLSSCSHLSPTLPDYNHEIHRDSGICN